MNGFSDDHILRLFKTRIHSFKHITYDGEQWTYELLEAYHQYFSRFLKLNGNKLDNVVFPKLETSFFSQDIFNSVSGELIFSNCLFLDGAYFQGLTIENIQFENCMFEGSLSFDACEITKIEIKSSIFSEYLSVFGRSTIKSLSIDYCKVFGSISFKGTYFEEKFNLSNTSIANSISFEKTKFITEEESLITGIRDLDLEKMDYEWFSKIKEIENQYRYIKEKRNNTIFDFAYSIKKEDLLTFIFKSPSFTDEEKIEYEEKVGYYLNPPLKTHKPVISFENTIVIKPLTFYWLNLENFSFPGSSIEEIIFSNCDWNIKNRLILGNEKHIEIENQYRQLKRIFTKKQDWEMSGLAYISEMEMRKKRLGYEVDDGKRYLSKDALEYLIYSFYSFFGGYTQNFARPLFFFLLFTFILFPSIYFLSEPNSSEVFNLLESFEKSISNAFPFIESEYQTENWWLKTLQIIFSSTLLAFIILGLRKRFKQ
ncbi:MAG: pentapeptide repeat-containing protein [Flavobacteriaceae bacterium]